ncbi:MAG: hypothetical protein R3F13_13315 [Prosthecobacter sp.]
MASIISRGDSLFYFLSEKRRDGTWHKRKLPIRRDDPDARRKCAMALAAAQAREAAMIPAGEQQLRGWSWVPGFIEDHYTNPKSRQRAYNAWAPVQVFLDQWKIDEPALVTFAHGHEYVAWRQNPPASSGIKARSKNTALTEIKLFSVVLQHAVKLGLALANPLFRLGIRKDPPKEKVEITEDEMRRIQAALADEPPWMADAWLVATKLGCRIGQTGTLMKDVDERSGTIRLLEQKQKRHTAPLHDDLRALVQRRRAEGAERLVDVPAVPGPRWWKFFRRIGMPHLCFHSTRVTVITRLARAGVSEQQTKAYIGHASSAVHEIYTKLKATDVAHVQKFL